MGCSNSTLAQSHLAEHRTPDIAKHGKKQDGQPPNLLEARTAPADAAADESKTRASKVTMADDQVSTSASEAPPEADPVPGITQPPTSELLRGAAVTGGAVPEEAPAAPQPQTPPQPQAMKIKIGASEVSVAAEQEAIDLAKAVNAAPFKDWVRTIEKEPRMVVEKILVQSVDMFGPRVGFVKFKADVKVDGKAPPGVVFMRGGSVAVLVVLKHGTTSYTVLVRQPRVAVGKAGLPEIPAGMLDGEGKFAGVAAKELKEETGVSIAETDLIDMTHLAFGDEYPGMYPSCGACDEFNRLFLYRKEVSATELADMQGRLHGVASEGEVIKLEVIPLADLWKTSPDAKALGALCLHDKLIAEGKIQPF